MALSKFGRNDWLAGWLNPSGTGTAAVQAVSITNPTGAEYGTGTPLPVLVSSTPVTPVSTPIAAGTLTLQTDPCTFYGANITTVATAGYLMLFDAIAAPADGTVTPVKVWIVAANSTLEVGYTTGLAMAIGATLVFSSTGPFSKTVSASVFMSGEAV
ncbi:MAG: hypothetical protein WC829_04505 [Hyphomicrobium sp.]|jgi:hypothetical protein